MNFVIYFFDEKGLVGSQSFAGGIAGAEVIAASGIILRKAIRATINDAQTDEELKVERGCERIRRPTNRTAGCRGMRLKAEPEVNRRAEQALIEGNLDAFRSGVS